MQIIGDEEIEAVARTIKSGNLSRYSWGKQRVGECDLFEKELSEKFAVSHSLLLTSGTNALIGALAGCGIGPGDEVIIPAYTYIATAGAVLAVGAIPVIANIDDTFTLNPEEIERNLTSKTRAVIPVHMNGFPCNMEKIRSITRKHGLYLIEDVCQAMGGSFAGQLLGTFGDAGCFSFNNYKILTCGEGGAIVTNQKKLFERAFINHDMGINFREYLDSLDEEVFLGQSMRVSEISGAIMRVQLRRLDSILASLRERKQIMKKVLEGSSAFSLPRSNCSAGDCSTSIVLTLPNANAAQRAEKILRENEILGIQLSSFYRHIVTSWEPVLQKRIGHHPMQNPYLRFDLRDEFELSKFSKSIDLLSKAVILFVPIQSSLEEVEKLATRIKYLITI